MRKSIIIAFMLITSALMLTSCGKSDDTSETLATEIVYPDTLESSQYTIYCADIYATIDTPGSTKFGAESTDSTAYVYESDESFDYCSIYLMYSPNYERLLGHLPDGTYMQELDDGYVAVLESYGLSDKTCELVLDNISFGGSN